MIANFGEAIKRPFTNLKDLLLGIVLGILPIINWFVFGYFLECSKTAMKKKFQLPEWKNFGSLFVHGLLYLVIGLIYFIPALIFIMIALGRALISIGQTEIMNLVSTNDTELFIQTIMPELIKNVAIFVIGAILAVIAIYVIPSALVNFSNNYKFSDAFNSKIWKKAFTGSYFLTFIVLMIYSWLVMWIVDFIPYVGPAIGSFITGVALLTGIGEIYSKI